MKKLFTLLLAVLLLLCCSAVALADADLTLESVEVDGDEISRIRNNMSADIPYGAYEVELELLPTSSLVEVAMELTSITGVSTVIEPDEIDSDGAYIYTIDFTDEDLFPDRYELEYVFEIVITDNLDATKTKTKTYKLTLETVQSELLSELVINTNEDSKSSGVLLGTDFESDEFEYEVFLPDIMDTDEVYLWIYPEDDDYRVEVNGKNVKSSKREGYAVELDGGKNRIEILVENDDDEEYALYIITIERENASAANETVSDLYVSSSESTRSKNQYLLRPEYDPNHDEYAVFLPAGTTEVFIRADLEDRDNFLYYGDNYVDDFDKEFVMVDGLADGNVYEVDITVMEDDNEDEDDIIGTYKIYLIVGLTEDSDEVSDEEDATLDDLYVKQKTGSSSYTKVALDTKFKAKTDEYTVTLDKNAQNRIRIYAEPSEDYAYVLINDRLLLEKDYLDFYVKTGANKYTITVIPPSCDEDHDDAEEYTLTVNYAGVGVSPGVPVDATSIQLASLTIKDSYGNPVAYSPVFAPNQHSYVTSVSNATAYISFTCQVQTASKLYLNGYAQVSGQPSGFYSLSEGNNSIPIQVYAADGTSGTYYVNVYRQPALLKYRLSQQRITIDGMPTAIGAYNVNGNNFVKVRDIAYALQNTTKKFAVGYHPTTNVVTLTSGGLYQSNGQENVPLIEPLSVIASPQSIYLDDKLVTPMAYNIDGNNCVMLRDIGLLLNFYVGYTKATETVSISTTSPYSAS